MKEIIFALVLVIFLFWYFNIKSKNKCILVSSECDDNDITCCNENKCI